MGCRFAWLPAAIIAAVERPSQFSKRKSGQRLGLDDRAALISTWCSPARLNAAMDSSRCHPALAVCIPKLNVDEQHNDRFGVTTFDRLEETEGSFQ